LEALSDAELKASAMALTRCDRFAVARALLAELERRQAAEPGADVVGLRLDHDQLAFFSSARQASL
jgi:hypothetical protein